MLKKILKILGLIILIPVVLFAALIGVLTLTEYKPAEMTEAEIVTDQASHNPGKGDTLSLVTWNIGYGGLGADSDFFMDGGHDTRSADRETVASYLDGQHALLADVRPDILMLQEIDADSTRTYHLDERPAFAGFSSGSEAADAAFAPNYKTLYVPYPLPPIGKVTSGLMTVSAFDTVENTRLALPCPFSWPIRLANLKRCLLVTRLPLEDSDKELVVINLHLEAYDDGSGKIAQTKVLTSFLESEYQKGNYVIAGGDFNQIFPDSAELYPNEHPDLWAVGELNKADLPKGFAYAYDMSTPTCRLLNQPYDPSDAANTQHYVIDGFIISDNLDLDTVETLDEGFANSDHNPVRIDVTLR